MSVFSTMESEVRSYVRAFPVVFDTARGEHVWDEDGREYIDFFCGAGGLNYGHNDPHIRQAVIDFLFSEKLQHGLDMATTTKRRFLETFRDVILVPRNLDYKVQFTGPTGANAVEAALKLARQVTGRTTVVAFTHAFHGLSLGALATTANSWFRTASGVPLHDVVFHPYDGYFGADTDTVAMLRTLVEDPSSGLDLPAAVIVETVQGEGGINVASNRWLQSLAELCTDHGILLIVDDIQIGIGRSGDFFSFEEAGITPDLVVLSKSLSGYGFPLSVVLIRPELDVWKPAGHTGTFRGNNVAFVAATAALERYWARNEFTAEIGSRVDTVAARLESMVAQHPDELSTRGRGLLRGLIGPDPAFATATARECFRNGLIIETSGAHDEVLKLIPAITGDATALDAGLDIIEDAVTTVLADAAVPSPAAI